MKFAEGGARAASPLPTKKALREALAAAPAAVELYSTSTFGNEWSGRASDLPAGVSFIVCGPDPYARRNWWATVKRTGDRVTVS